VMSGQVMVGQTCVTSLTAGLVHGEGKLAGERTLAPSILLLPSAAITSKYAQRVYGPPVEETFSPAVYFYRYMMN
ncbi:jg27094, partial [Pararge aegeria aegeria]